MLPLPGLARWQLLRIHVYLMHIIPLDCLLFHQVSDAVHQTAADPCIKAGALDLVELVEHEAEVRALKSLLEEFGRRLLQVPVEGTLALETQVRETIVVL